MISIVIGGDLCPTEANSNLFDRGDAATLFGDLLPEFQKADLSIVNLECPLIRKPSPIQKIGPILGAKDSCINAIKQAGIEVLNVANNHIMDHGSQGLNNTLEICKKSGIELIGAGENLDAARKILIKEVGQMRVGILSMAEHEFSIATETGWGAAPLDAIDFVRSVREHRSEYDYLIVLVHGGNEGYPYPRPSLMKICRFFAEQGANAVICQHSHCAGCYESYRNGHIVYGQGNLLFEPKTQMARSWYEGFLVVLEVDQDCKSRMEVIPYAQSDPEPGVRRMGGTKEKEFLSLLAGRSKTVLDQDFVARQWDIFCGQRSLQYLKLLYGNESVLQRVVNKFRFPLHLYSRDSMMRKLNLIRCESHREILMKVLASM